MSSEVTLGSSIRAEWIKFRTIKSTIICVILMVILTIGLGALISLAQRSAWAHHTSRAQKLTFDPTNLSLSGIVFAQFAVGVIGSLLITSEYASGSIRTSLAAIPRRFTLASSKLIVMVITLFVTTEIACFAAFVVSQSILSGVTPTASLSDGSALRAVIFGGLYLTIIAAVAFALGLIVRHTAACISIFVILTFVLFLVTLALPSSWQNVIDKFEPGQLGNAMTSVIQPTRSFAPVTALIILLIYAIVLNGVGMALLQRRDA